MSCNIHLIVNPNECSKLSSLGRQLTISTKNNTNKNKKQRTPHKISIISGPSFITFSHAHAHKYCTILKVCHLCDMALSYSRKPINIYH